MSNINYFRRHIIIDIFKVIDAKVFNNHTLIITFSNNEVKLFDIKPYLKEEVFISLKDITNFSNFHIDELGSIEWESGASLSFNTLYIDSIDYNHR